MVSDNQPSWVDSTRAAHEAGVAAWPGVDLSVGDFTHHLEALLGGSKAGEILARHGADLFLACACAAGNPRAIEHFSRSVLGAVPMMVAHILPRGATLDDLVQSLHELTLVRRGPLPPAIATYRGTGPLLGWVRIMATRAAVRAKKSSLRFTEGIRLDARPDVSTIGPETLFTRLRYGDALNAAVRDAFAALPDGQRALLRSYYVDGLSVDQLAERDGIHRATAARRVQSARRVVLTRFREHAIARLGITGDEIDSLIGLVASRLEISLRVLEPNLEASSHS